METDAQRDAAQTDAEGAAATPEPTPAEREAIRRMLDEDAEDAYRADLADWERDAQTFGPTDPDPR
jgi:hypothetical protein